MISMEELKEARRKLREQNVDPLKASKHDLRKMLGLSRSQVITVRKSYDPKWPGKE